MIDGRPVFDGAVQVTSRLVVLPEVDVTVGATGASGFSVALVMLMVTEMVSFAVPSLALTLTA